MKNTYLTKGEVTEIYITRQSGERFISFISTVDIARVVECARSWYVNEQSGPDGLYRVEGRVNTPEGVKRTSLHRFILEAPEDLEVDHIDNNPLNNTRSNLRLATPHQNQQNRTGAMRNSKSGIRGVYWNTNENKWKAQIAFFGKQKCIGYFTTVEAAEEAVKAARAKYYEFSKEGMAVTAALKEAA